MSSRNLLFTIISFSLSKPHLWYGADLRAAGSQYVGHTQCASKLVYTVVDLSPGLPHPISPLVHEGIFRMLISSPEGINKECWPWIVQKEQSCPPNDVTHTLVVSQASALWSRTLTEVVDFHTYKRPILTSEWSTF